MVKEKIKKRKRLKSIGKNPRPIKVDRETHKKIMDAKRRLSNLQDRDVSAGEIIRRLSRIPNSRFILEKDARDKRRSSR